MSSVWKEAVSEYFALLGLSPDDAKVLAYPKTASEVVTLAVQPLTLSSRKREKSAAFAQKLFIAAVASGGTHNELVQHVDLLANHKPMSIVTDQIAMFLRYADAVDKFLDSLGNTTFAGAFVFGAVRYLLDVAVNNFKLFIAIKTNLEDISSRLRRLDNYLMLREPTEAVTMMCIRVLVDILRFCGLATEYLRSIDRTCRKFL
jgi:hypothetical protein